ncbi:MAG: DNA primase [Chloroflexota bacterium]
MSVTQEIKDRLDIVQYVQEHVPDLKKAGRYYKACCPFHGENTPSFVVNAETQSWRCFGACAEGGDIFTFAQKINGWDFKEALRELGERAGVQLRERSPEQKQQDARLDKLRGILETAAEWYHENLFKNTPDAEQALFYTLDKRGFNEDTIRTWGIGFAPDGWRNMLDALKNIGYAEDDIVDAGIASRNDKGNVYDRFRNRLIIPIRDERGRMVGFGARALAPDDEPKYLNSPQNALFDKSSTLFGLDRAKTAIRDTETAVIVEGYMDVIQAHQAGYANVVAQMGTAMTETQLGLLAPRYATNVIMALDADDAGQNAMRRSLDVAREALQSDYMGKMSVDIRVLQIDDAKDPDDVLRETPDKWQGYVDNAVPVADFVINLETSALPNDASLQARQQVAQSVLPILTASESNLYTQENIQKLAMRLRIPEADLLAWARELARTDAAKKARARRNPPPPPQDAPAETASRQAPKRLEMPPLPDDDDGYGSSEEPPAFFGDEAPVTYQDDAYHEEPAPLKLPSLSGRSTSRATEAYCLRMLLLDPSTLAHVNRKLRELAGDNDRLMAGPLSAFGTQDFSQGDYRIILDTLHAALHQHERDPMKYLEDHLDSTLLAELTALMQDEPDDIHTRIKGRLGGEFSDIWDKFARSVRPSIDIQGDVVQRALSVRCQRLEREQQEMRFLLEDARQAQDNDAERQYFERTVPTMQAIRVLHQALSDLKQNSSAW